MTLLEVLLYVVLLTIILLAASSFVTVFLDSRVKNQVIAEVEQQGGQAIQVITQAIRNSEALTSPVPGSSADSLVLDVFDAANDPTVFSLSGGVLMVSEGGGVAIPLTSQRVVFSGLSFENFSRADTPGTVRITFTLSYNSTTTQTQYNYSKTFHASASIRGLGSVMGGSGICQGTPTACSSFADDPSCSAQSGCLWGVTWACNGASCDCSGIPNQLNCDGTSSCAWQVPAGTCGGTGNCTTINDQTTCNTAGCFWFGFWNMCTNWAGNPNCAAIPDEPTCMEASCTWTPGVGYCSGTCACTDIATDPLCTTASCSWDFTATCSGTPSTCNAFSDQTTCEAQAGCGWI